MVESREQYEAEMRHVIRWIMDGKPFNDLSNEQRHMLKECYLAFPETPGIPLAPDKRISFQVHTSRGILTKSVTLGQPERLLHIT